MSDTVLAMLQYLGYILAFTLGAITLCGLSVRLLSRAFSALYGHRASAVFDLTAVVGTPIHELGHLLMCPLFGHKILRVRLWSPKAENGVYGFVEHSYNRKNPWAQLGNLFIGVGPIFSGLGVVVLTLLLCFPTEWSSYLASSELAVSEGGSIREMLTGIFSLFLSLPAAFAEDWLRSTVGLLLMLSVSLHVSLSWADIKGSLGALPIYCLMVTVFGLVTYFFGISGAILAALRLFNLRLLSLFALVIAFCALWVLLALLFRLIRLLIRCF